MQEWEKRYRVQLYAVVRVPIEVVATDQTDALRVAEEAFEKDVANFLYRGEFADELTSALVDEDGDVEYGRSQLYVPARGGWKQPSDLAQNECRGCGHRLEGEG